MSPRRALAAALVAAALLGAAPPAAWPAGTALADGARFDALLLLAEQAPERARAALAEPGADGTPAQARELALLRAWVTVRSGADGAAQAAALDALSSASARLTPRLAEGDLPLLRALQAERDGRLAVEGLAQQALTAYDAYCAGLAPLQADCEYRTRWQARQLLAQHAMVQRASGPAREHAQAARVLAAAGADRWRQAWSECQLALAAAAAGDTARAAAHLDEARTLAGHTVDPTLAQRLAYTEARLAWAGNDSARAGAALEHMLALARAGGSLRQQAVALANLSDHALKTAAPRRGLLAAEQGLALLEATSATPLRNVLVTNAMLARAALGQLAEARRDFELLQAGWGETGASGRQLTTLREYGDALASAGDLKGALEMHHRGQALAERLMTANRDAALAELRTRFDSEAQQRRILLLERNNALTGAALANQALNQRLWAIAGGVLALAAALLLLLALRVRDTRRKLEHHQASLRVQSERDALTGVASRRHAQALMRSAGEAAGGFAGALLMIDIDHFKQINDTHGHAVGDRVLAEVARRIAAVVRPQDLVARWGGEEFLVHAAALPAGEAEVLARRVLQAVGGSPVALGTAADGAALRVTVSIGHGLFPLPPHRLPLSPEQAANLADMALYIAKSQGRHRAVGITACTAEQAEALRAVEADFERAWQDGRIGLHADLGPGAELDNLDRLARPPADTLTATATAATTAGAH